MPPDLANPTSQTGSVATPPPAEPTSGQDTVQSNGQATGQGAPVEEESFTKLDPRTLPPHLKASYDSMLRDYKDKTTKLSETVKSETQKAVEAFQQKAGLYDQISGQEEFVRQWNEYVQAKAQQNTDPNHPDKELVQKVQKLENAVLKSTAVETINAFASSVDDKGKPMHPNFDKLNEIVVNEIDNGDGSKKAVTMLAVAIDAATGRTMEEKIANGYAIADKVYNSIFEEGRKAGLGRLNTKILNGTQPPSAMPASSTAGRRPKNALEALEFARQGLPVHKG